MELLVDIKSMATPMPRIITKHGNQVLYWEAGFDKKVFIDGDLPPQNDVMKHINHYWSLLDIDKQARIFECYSRIRMLLEEVYDMTELINSLKPEIKLLYDEHNVEDFKHWIYFKTEDDNKIIIPERFEEDYIVSDMKPGSRAKTYTRSDYVELIAMTMQLRVIIPVWCEFLSKSKASAGTNYKEKYAFDLLAHTDIPTSAAMDKLKTYVENNLQNDKPQGAAILAGVGSQDYTSWILSLILVRRLCLGDITGSNPKTNLVTYIYNFVNQGASANRGGSFGNMVKDKPFESPNGGSDNNASRTEGYKVKQDVAIGDIVMIETYMGDAMKVAKTLDPNIDTTLLKSCLESCKALDRASLLPAQIRLSQWILSSVIPPRGMQYLSKKVVINCIAIAQTWLWQRGHKELSVLISALPSSSSGEVMLGGLDSRARIPVDAAEMIMKIYPFTSVRSLKQKQKPENSVIKAIDSVALLLSQRDWVLTAIPEHVGVLTGSNNYTRYSCPHDVKVKLAALILDLKRDTIEMLKNKSNI